jgi:N-acetyl-1-D-myo-inositol-2-amino-2-deoxy-alpha-D-glucopyranoside deacetylase
MTDPVTDPMRASQGRDDADTTAVLDRREAATAEHGSQVSPFNWLSPLLRRAFLATDHLARVHRPRA